MREPKLTGGGNFVEWGSYRIINKILKEEDYRLKDNRRLTNEKK